MRSGQPVAGRIINTTSGAGLDGNFGQTNYATAKAAIVGLTLTLSVELASIGCTANIIGPGALTRISATMPGMPTPKEPDEFAEDQFDPMDPAISSPLVAWLGSNEAGHVTGLCIKALRDKIIWMRGFSEARCISNGNKRWDAAKLGRVLGTDLFGTQASGLRFG